MVAPQIRCREISEADIDAVADLLTHGFDGRSRHYWIVGLRRQATREVPDGYPRFGYMLDRAGLPVGVLLLLYTSRTEGTATTIRCNLSSWYFEPEFRHHAPLLTRIAQKNKEVSYSNITPAAWTWPVIEAQGFSVYCNGVFFSIPALSRAKPGMTVGPDTRAVEGLSTGEIELLARHARYGCLNLICRTAAGDAQPFILLPVRARRGWIRPPAMRLIYCRGIADYVQCAGAIGRFLMRRGKIWVMLDANGAVPGLIGHYTEARGRKYFKGPHQPRLGDLTDTELALYGP